MFLNFKKWINEEYWGYGFAQEKDLVNGPAYKARGIRSKYTGMAYKNSDVPNFNPDKKFGFDMTDKAKINSRK